MDSEDKFVSGVPFSKTWNEACHQISCCAGCGRAEKKGKRSGPDSATQLNAVILNQKFYVILSFL